MGRMYVTCATVLRTTMTATRGSRTASRGCCLGLHLRIHCRCARHFLHADHHYQRRDQWLWLLLRLWSDGPHNHMHCLVDHEHRVGLRRRHGCAWHYRANGDEWWWAGLHGLGIHLLLDLCRALMHVGVHSGKGPAVIHQTEAMRLAPSCHVLLLPFFLLAVFGTQHGTCPFDMSCISLSRC